MVHVSSGPSFIILGPAGHWLHEMSTLIRSDPIVLGTRLRDARLACSLTQEQAADALSVARTTLVAIEQGARRVQATELLKLCTLYNVPSNTLLQSQTQQVELAAKFRRRSGGASADIHSAAAVEQLAKLLSATIDLEQMLQRPFNTNYPPPCPLGAGDVTRQAEDAALELRNRLGIGLAPVEDILSLLETEVGIRIFVRPIDSSISGVFAYSSDFGAAMLINSKHSRSRRSMTIAHETGHFLVNRNDVDVLSDTSVSDIREERFATSFGLAFLMPGVAVRRRFQDFCHNGSAFSARHLILMAHIFHVSPEAMCRRLEGLGLLPTGTFERLTEQGFSGTTVRAVLGDPAERDSYIASPRLSALVADAYQQQFLSEGQLAARLGMKRVEVREILDALDSLSAT
jgi:Zn-dependent peptidase ImmA (M78 family)/DNA-binding XRE family transcriptional regulator